MYTIRKIVLGEEEAERWKRDQKRLDHWLNVRKKQKMAFKLRRCIVLNDVPKALKYIKRGMDVNFIDARGQTFLQHAALYDSADVMQLLIDHGANVDLYTPNKDSEPPIFKHILFGRAHIVKMFVKAGANLEARDSIGNTAVLCAATWRSWAVLRMLLDAGADVTAKTRDGEDIMQVVQKAHWDEKLTPDLIDYIRKKLEESQADTDDEPGDNAMSD